METQIFHQGLCHTMALPFTLKSMLMQEKNYGNSNISPRVVSHYGLAIYIEKYVNAKEELWKLKYFTNAKKIITFQKKNPLKERNQNPSRYYYNSIITNLKCQQKPKYRLSKIPI